MFGIDNYPGFIMAGILLNIAPGTDTFYIISRSISQGTKAGVVSALGVCSGAVCHTLFAALGLSVILTTSATLFFTVKLIGALYLAYLGFMLLKAPPVAAPQDEQAAHPQNSLRKIYCQGILTNVLNPKVALFFLAFLPQFINTDSPYGPLPFLILGATFVTTGTLWCCFLACSAARTTGYLRKNNSMQLALQKITGLVFIGFGLQLALSKN